MSEDTTPKLYIWKPKGHGENSVILMAGSDVKAATEKANAMVKAALELKEDLYDDGELHHRYTEYEFGGWGTDYYELHVLDMNSAFFHEND